MSNLTEAKEELEKGKQLDQILNPQPKQKRIKLPLARDINLIERILNEKLTAKEKSLEEEALKQANLTWQGDLKALHHKAIALSDEFKALSHDIKSHSKGKIQLTVTGYTDGYWKDLPDTMDEATKSEALELIDNHQLPITNLRKEIDAHVLDIKLGLSPLSDVKLLLTKIDQLK